MEPWGTPEATGSVSLPFECCCFTPQDWILPHVVRNDAAGIHVTKVKLASSLYPMRRDRIVRRRCPIFFKGPLPTNL